MNISDVNIFFEYLKCYGSMVFQEDLSFCKECDAKYDLNENKQPDFIEKFLYEDDKEFEHISAVSKFLGDGWVNRILTEHQVIHANLEDTHTYGQNYVNNKPYGVGGLF